MKKIIVSVVMPVYNNAQYIKKSIDSVLCQNVPLELIIVNDGSTDSVDEVVEDYIKLSNVRYVKNKVNLGAAKSRNIGVGLAEGDYIAYLDADDYWLPTKLEKQVNVLDKYKYPICYTGRQLIKADGTPLGKLIRAKEFVDFKTLLHHNYISCSSVLLPTNIAKLVPMCNDNLHEDYINWLAILKDYGIAYGIDETLLMYRLSDNGKSRNRIKSATMTYGVYRYMGEKKMTSIALTFSHIYRRIISYKKFN